MEYIEISAKTVNDAITEACQKLGVTSDKLDYSVIEEGSNGFLGIGSRPASYQGKSAGGRAFYRGFGKEIFK